MKLSKKSLAPVSPTAPGAVELGLVTVAPAATVPPNVAPARAPRALRTVRNGVKHPLPGGKCHAVWALCDKVLAFSGAPPTTAAVTAHAVANGWNANNTTIELSYWRKYHGIPARAPKVAPATVEPAVAASA
jgi:hypothetical protein